MRHPPDLFLMKVFVAIFFTLFFLKIFFFSYSRLPSRSIEGSSCNLQNFTYALFCNRVLSATTSLKLPMKKSFIITRQFHEGQYFKFVELSLFSTRAFSILRFLSFSIWHSKHVLALSVHWIKLPLYVKTKSDNHVILEIKLLNQKVPMETILSSC